MNCYTFYNISNKEKQLRTSLLKNVAEKEKKHTDILSKLELYRDSDPAIVEAKGIYIIPNINIILD